MRLSFVRAAGTPAGRRVAAALAAAALVALGAWWRASLPSPPESPESASPPVSSADAASPPLLEVQGSRLVGSDEAGRRRWDLEAESVQVDRERRTVEIVGPRGRWYAGGEVAAVFAAPRGRYRADAGVIDLEGGVTVTTHDGRSVQARRIRWEVRAGTVEAFGDVVLRQPAALIRADRLRGDAALTTVVLQGRVTVEVRR